MAEIHRDDSFKEIHIVIDRALLGDEAVALGAVHAGISAAYGYPGTPSTEIMEFLLEAAADGRYGDIQAHWSSNEKTAYEEALGTSFSGKRALITMKHVGLNVAADPFINSAILDIKGGLVLAVADDPGMHSSQNEQDSRFFADYAMIPCLEPTSQQEAYEMTRRAFEMSEELSVPVMLRLVTRLSHSRAPIKISDPKKQNPSEKGRRAGQAGLLFPPGPANGIPSSSVNRTRWYYSVKNRSTTYLKPGKRPNIVSLELSPPDWHATISMKVPRISRLFTNTFTSGSLPGPCLKIRAVLESCDRVLILEEGMPFLERQIRGIGNTGLNIDGKLNGKVPRAGELNPDNVREALGLPALIGFEIRSRHIARSAAPALQGLPSLRFLPVHQGSGGRTGDFSGYRGYRLLRSGSHGSP